jgi:hypothetical protein
MLISILVADRDTVFLDEPEAFLHPPQAILIGRILMQEAPKDQ